MRTKLLLILILLTVLTQLCTVSAFAVTNGEKNIGNIQLEPSTVRNAPPEGRGRSGRAANKLRPDPSATGEHSTFLRDPQTGRVNKYTTWESNPRHPDGFNEGTMFHGTGRQHHNKVTGLVVCKA